MAISKIKTNSISDDAVTAAKIADGTIVAADLAADSVDSSELVAGSVDTAHIADLQVTTAKIAADAITAAKIADDVINSEHYAAASIDNEHLADDAVDSDELAAGSVDLAHMSVNSIDSDQYVDGSIDTAHIANDQITAALIADNALDSDMYVDGSIDTAHIADDQITLAKMAGLARGKIIYGDSSGNPAALAVGSNGQALVSDGTDISWGAAGASLSGSTNNTVATVTGSNALAGEANLTFDGTDLTVSTGNVVIGTSGKGIDFSATSDAGGMASELLDDYEEGTWTPTIGATAGTITTYTVVRAEYTKVGRMVQCQIYFYISNNGTGSGYVTCTLPFTTASENVAGAGGREIGHTANAISIQCGGSVNYVTIKEYDAVYPTQGGYNMFTFNFIV